MAQTGYVPISLYYSTTASAAPTAGNLVSGELAINITDGILFYKDNAGVIQTLASKAGTSGTYTSITLTGGTANGVAYLNGSKVVTTGSALTFNGTEFKVNAASGNVLVQPSNVANAKLYMRHGSIANNNGFEVDVSSNTIFLQAGSEQMRLTSTGLGIGTSSPDRKLTILSDNGMSIYNSAATSVSYIYFQDANTFRIGAYNGTGASLAFFTTPSGGGQTERARIDSSGNLLVGATSGVGKVRIEGGAGSTPAIYAYNKNATSGDYSAVFALGANNNNTSSFFLNCTEPGVANRFAIYGNGTYATLSDARIKKNIETTRDGYLNDVMKLRVVKYNWISQTDNEPKELGVIAQELEQVFPGLIQENKAEGADTAYKQVKASVIPFILLKALQEQQVLIEQLTARVAQLEGK